MLHDGDGLEILEEDDCQALLRTARLGRVALSHQALPVILPVTFAAAGPDLIFSVGSGLLAHAAEQGHIVCFQTDWTDPDALSAWSVSVVGQLSMLTNPIEIREAQALDIAPWSSAALRYVRLRPSLVSGRRQVMQAVAASGAHSGAGSHTAPRD